MTIKAQYTVFVKAAEQAGVRAELAALAAEWGIERAQFGSEHEYLKCVSGRAGREVQKFEQQLEELRAFHSLAFVAMKSAERSKPPFVDAPEV